MTPWLDRPYDPTNLQNRWKFTLPKRPRPMWAKCFQNDSTRALCKVTIPNTSPKMLTRWCWHLRDDVGKKKKHPGSHLIKPTYNRTYQTFWKDPMVIPCFVCSPTKRPKPCLSCSMVLQHHVAHLSYAKMDSKMEEPKHKGVSEASSVTSVLFPRRHTLACMPK